MASFFFRAAEAAGFAADRATKADLVAGERLFLGLNCFEPGQSQASHVHAGADKFYLVLAGKARIRIGDESQIAEPGTLAWAPAGVPHGVDEALERTVLLVGIAPPPGRR